MVKGLIKRNSRLYANSKINFLCKDPCVDDIKGGDLLIIRQVLQHLNNKSILKIIEKFDNYQYIIVSEHQLLESGQFVSNKDMLSSGSTRLRERSAVYLDKPPFNYPIDEQIYSIPEPSFGQKAAINTFLIKPNR